MLGTCLDKTSPRWSQKGPCNVGYGLRSGIQVCVPQNVLLSCAVQVLSTRKRKDVEVADIKVQVCLYAFDCLYLDGEMLLQRPLTERRSALVKAVEEKPGELQYALYKVQTLWQWYGKQSPSEQQGRSVSASGKLPRKVRISRCDAARKVADAFVRS